MTELDAFILALDVEMRAGLRAEQALRKVVVERVRTIREQLERDIEQRIQDGSFGDK